MYGFYTGESMRHFVWLWLAGALLLMGCRTTASVYERDDLVTITHNKESDYTLLIYQSPTGRIRNVLRRKGVCELLLYETNDGDFFLVETLLLHNLLLFWFSEKRYHLTGIKCLFSFSQFCKTLEVQGSTSHEGERLVQIC